MKYLNLLLLIILAQSVVADGTDVAAISGQIRTGTADFRVIKPQELLDVVRADASLLDKYPESARDSLLSAYDAELKIADDDWPVVEKIAKENFETFKKHPKVFDAWLKKHDIDSSFWAVDTTAAERLRDYEISFDGENIKTKSGSFPIDLEGKKQIDDDGTLLYDGLRINGKLTKEADGLHLYGDIKIGGGFGRLEGQDLNLPRKIKEIIIDNGQIEEGSSFRVWAYKPVTVKFDERTVEIEGEDFSEDEMGLDRINGIFRYQETPDSKRVLGAGTTVIWPELSTTTELEIRKTLCDGARNCIGFLPKDAVDIRMSDGTLKYRPRLGSLLQVHTDGQGEVVFKQENRVYAQNDKGVDKWKTTQLELSMKDAPAVAVGDIGKLSSTIIHQYTGGAQIYKPNGIIADNERAAGRALSSEERAFIRSTYSFAKGMEQRPKNIYATLIYSTEGSPPLSETASDALLMKAALMSQGVPGNNIEIVPNPDKKQLLEAVKRGANQPGIPVIYYSGHGDIGKNVPKYEPYLSLQIPPDEAIIVGKQGADQIVRSSEISDALKGTAPLFIADSCYGTVFCRQVSERVPAGVFVGVSEGIAQSSRTAGTGFADYFANPQKYRPQADENQDKIIQWNERVIAGLGPALSWPTKSPAIYWRGLPVYREAQK